MNMPKLHKSLRSRCKHSVLLITGAIGAVLFWRGTWALADITPVLENPWVSLLVGIFVLVLSHQLYREL